MQTKLIQIHMFVNLIAPFPYWYTGSFNYSFRSYCLCCHPFPWEWKSDTIKMYLWFTLGLPRWCSGKESINLPMQEIQETWVQSWVGKIPWSRKWQPTPEILPEKSHGQRSLVGYSPWGHKELDTTDWAQRNSYCVYDSLNCWVMTNLPYLKFSVMWNLC